MQNNVIRNVISSTSDMPVLRSRPQLTSFQITDQQKVSIDNAYDLFQRSGGGNANKGEFIEMLAQKYTRERGGSITQGMPRPTQSISPMQG